MSASARIVRDPFPPLRSEPCFCGSGRRFKHCCGDASRRDPPHGITVVEDFLDSDRIADWAEFLSDRASEPLTVVDVEATTEERVVRRPDPRRVTERVDVGPRQSALDALVERALTKIGDERGCRFRWYERPQVLKYLPGGRYDTHADSDNVDPVTGAIRKDLDRDVSLLIYLNDDYEGGRLGFDHFGWSLRPRAGMLVHFPSDYRYVHTARPVTAGERYAVVSWASIEGAPRVRRDPPEDAVLLPGKNG
ncbi:MAG: 2OG-Fe(II) oxygenase [Wenzhouxiangellaceae bacterium]|nr:2OG-Fe(II) oxygenase [Wenzhouxiangellaceae bacterium]